jgi:hypothetical protein
MGRRRLLRLGAPFAGAFLLVTMASPAGAQRVDSLRRRWALPTGAHGVTSLAANASRAAPGNSVSSPSAFGANMGDVFVGAGYQNTERLNNEHDYAAVAGFGLGNSRSALGLEVAFTSFSTVRSGFGQTGGVSLKLHRVLPHDFGVAVGYENAGTWGAPNGGHSWYGVVSDVRNLTDNPTGFLGSIVLNAGIGNGRFRDVHITTLSTGQVIVGTPRQNIGFFASGGLRLHRTTSLVADWGGQDLSVGLSIAPFASFPLVLAPALADVTERANSKARFILGVGFGYHMRNFGQ